jgi:asparagine synthase (glutamine-hydrolysing)
LTIAAKLAGIEPDQLFESIRNRVAWYPESSYSGMYVHFMLAERTTNWLFEGEDRNRQFFWSCSPFYSTQFFKAAMNCPARLKKDHKLFRAFLNHLNRDIAKIKDANRNLAPASSLYSKRIMLGRLISQHPNLARSIRKLVYKPQRAHAESKWSYLLKHQISNSKHATVLFDADTLIALSNNCSELSETAIDNIVTIIAAFEFVKESRTSLESFYDKVVL